MSRAGQGSRPVRRPPIETLIEQLSARDWAIVSTLDRLRLATGTQFERLYFAYLTGRSRNVMRARVLKRLVDAHAITTLGRPIGGARRGSSGLVYALDTTGQRLVQLQANRTTPTARLRRPPLPGERFVAHTLAVTELLVGLVEISRAVRFRLAVFQAEADAYWPNGLGGWLKPDAFVRLERPGTIDYWWYEADLATESLPTVRTKLLAYLDFVQRGQLGPDDIVPRVMFGVPTSQRQLAIQGVVAALPEPAAALFAVTLLPEAPRLLVRALLQGGEG